MLIYFSAAFDGVTHHGILYRLCYVGIGGSVLSILTQFLSNRSQHVMVDGCRSKLVDVVSGLPQGIVLGPLLFLPFTCEHFSILVNKLIGYADASTLMAVVLPVLEYCSAVWCSAADTHLKLLDRAVSGAQFLTEGVFECDIAHRRSVAVLCMLYKIICSST